MLTNIIEKIIKVIYPTRCGICGKLGKDICENCYLKLSKYQINKQEINENIKRFYIYKYEDEIRKILLKYKFGDCPYLYKTFEKIILNNKKMCSFLKYYDIIIPVPIHNKRNRERGYNQSALIAKIIAQDCNLQYIDALKKTINTTPQSKLTKLQREKNAKGVYELKKQTFEKLTNKKIIIFDDIYTTGSTTLECAREIQKAKPKKIGIAIIAKD